MAFFARLGEPAPRESYCRLYINNVYQGLYSIVESVDTPFLSRTYGSDQGYLFEFQYQREWHGDYLGDELAAYKPFFQPETHELEPMTLTQNAETHELEPDATLYAPIRDLFREANAEVDSVWRERVERFIDLRQLIRHVAVDTFLAEDDGFIGAYGMNNFFLHRPSGSTVHSLIPWDKDNAFIDVARSIFQRTGENVLFARALAFSDLRALYLDVLEECARSAADERLAGRPDRSPRRARRCAGQGRHAQAVLDRGLPRSRGSPPAICRRSSRHRAAGGVACARRRAVTAPGSRARAVSRAAPACSSAPGHERERSKPGGAMSAMVAALTPLVAAMLSTNGLIPPPERMPVAIVERWRDVRQAPRLRTPRLRSGQTP